VIKPTSSLVIRTTRAVLKGAKRTRAAAENQTGTRDIGKEKPPIFAWDSTWGEVVLRMLSNVKQATIAPGIQNTITLARSSATDEYRI